jgi:alpha-L-arabinofuranosidase
VQSVFAANTGTQELPVKIDQPVLAPKPAYALAGAVGIGTWDTQAQFKDITVTSGQTTLYASNLVNGDSEWKFGQGTWTLANSMLTQTSNAKASLAYVGDPNWTDYSMEVHAMKLSGSEGFLIIVHRKSSQDFVQFNFAGWGNTRTTIQRFYPGGESREIAPAFPQRVVANRWYDIRIDVHGSHVACFVDGRQRSSADDFADPDPNPLYASASHSSNGESDIKVVNVGSQPITTTLDLQSAKSLGKWGRAIAISGDPSDQNSIATPTKIAPIYASIPISGKEITHIFPAHSVTVLVVKDKGH